MIFKANSARSDPGIIWVIAGTWLFTACQLPVETLEYEKKLVVFGNLSAYTPFTDTLYVSFSSSLEGAQEENDVAVPEAEVTVTGAGDTVRYHPVAGKPGSYVAQTFQVVHANQTYRLDVIWDRYHVSATTLVPDTVTVESVESEGWECQGRQMRVPPIDLHRDENIREDILEALSSGDFSHLVMDTVTYREGSCYSSSFASIPMFVIRWEAELAPGVIRAVSLALEDTVTNAIMDTSLAANAFKGPMYLDNQGNYFRPNPVVWNLSQPELHFGWLSFNYLGPHVIMIQATDTHFRNYFQGDAFRQNPYILPQSNIAGGYGLFSSLSTQYFMVHVAPETAGNGLN